jgi:FtsH-binding integral membrane protein
MNILWLIFAAVFAIAGGVSSILIIIDAFQDEIWKGIVCLLCGLYLVYYSIFEYENDNKWIIVLLSLAGSAMAGFCYTQAFPNVAPQ